MPSRAVYMAFVHHGMGANLHQITNGLFVAFQIEIVFQRGNTLVMMLLLLQQKAYLYVAPRLLFGTYSSSKDTKFQRLGKYILLNTMATWLDPNFAAAGEYEWKNEQVIAHCMTNDERTFDTIRLQKYTTKHISLVFGTQCLFFNKLRKFSYS